MYANPFHEEDPFPSPESARLRRRNFLRLIGGSAVLPVVTSAESADPYPQRTITIVVPYPPGGGSDTVARLLAEPLRAALGQAVIVENVGGAAGNLGTGRVARSSPDGYSIVIGNWATHVANAAIYSQQFDVRKDFEPIALVVANSWLVLVRRDFPARSLHELTAWLRANPDQATVGTGGIGSGEHVSALLFQRLTGLSFRFIPFRGVAAALQALIAGDIDIVFTGPGPSLQHVKAGTIRALAVTSRKRLDWVPHLPTLEEAGVEGYEFAYWHALWAPKGTSRVAISKLNEAVVAAMAEPGLRKRLLDLGQDLPSPEHQTPEALAAFHQSEIARWWPVIKAANIVLD